MIKELYYCTSRCMQPDDPHLEQITIYLKRLSAGDSAAESPLADAVYAEMQRIARKIVRPQAGEFSLPATALVNEVLLELVRLRSVEWKDREHFFRVAARLLRRRFIDYIRMQRADKRPQKRGKVDIEALLLPNPERFEEVIFVNEGLDQLAEFDVALAELVEMVYFGGVSIAAIAQIRGVSEKTIDRHLDLARRWLEARFRVSCPPLISKAAID
jgi:RNA polymerase sigma factor (TIGR02999 family)